MSTRAHIAFYKDKAAAEDHNNFKSLIYKHNDGYPEGVLPVLKDSIKQGLERRGWDCDYLAAWYLHDLIADHIEHGKELAIDIKKNIPSIDDAALCLDGRDYMSHGICNEIHHDVEYLYQVLGVDMSTKTATIRVLVPEKDEQGFIKGFKIDSEVEVSA